MRHFDLRPAGIILLFCAFSLALSAQTTCTYTLNLFDDVGDGWGQGSLILSTNGVPEAFALESGFFSSAIPISFTEGDTLVLSYSPGQFESDVRFNLTNNLGEIIFQAGPTPAPGDSLLVLTSGQCNTCRGPELNSVRETRVRSEFIRLAWSPDDDLPAASYEVAFEAGNFDPDTVSVRAVSDTIIQINDLSENTAYEYYIRGVCADGDRAPWQGPFRVRTPFTNDVGIVGVMEPVSDCGLTGVTPVLIIKNFGGKSQSFIPYNYEVNGQPANIPMPQEGVYTGVLGVDSTDEATFDLSFNFSAIGEYDIVAWTELEEDSVRDNDTFRITIVNQPIVQQLPYNEGFEASDGFWRIATESQNPSWQLGRPQSGALNLAGNGQRAWVTNTEGSYNDNERSFLVSPCFNFANLNADPQLSFQLFVETEECCDRAWLEFSLDGEAWERLGSSNTGINWYNNPTFDWWEGSGGFTGWATASHPLTGLAGEPKVQFRFVFESNEANGGAGIGIDEFTVFEQPGVDLLLGQASRISSNPSCGSEAERFAYSVSNLGDMVSEPYSIGIRIEQADTIVGQAEQMINNGVPAGETLSTELMTQFDLTPFGEYSITLFISSSDTTNLTFNDTLRFQFTNLTAVPYREDFEAGIVPAQWSVDPDVEVTQGHGNTEFVLSDNLWAADTVFSIRTPNFDTVVAIDTFFFDYRIVDGATGRTAVQLGAADRIFVRAYSNCSEVADTLFTISSENHVATTDFARVALPLADFAGNTIQLEFFGEWGSGDYFVDFDRIVYQRCAGSLSLQADVTDASSGTAADGQILLLPGSNTGPYSFEWTNLRGDTPEQTGLLAGTYSVTVTDAFGCTDSLNAVVDVAVSTQTVAAFIDQLQLAPNPTSGLVDLQVKMHESQAVRMDVLTVLGQSIERVVLGRTDRFTHQFDLSAYPAGIYFIRIQAGDRSQTVRLLKRAD